MEAARNGHLSTVKILREFGRERDECCLTARAVAEASGHVEVARWLDESDPDLFSALQEAVSDLPIDGGSTVARAMGVEETSIDGSIISTDSGAGGAGEDSEIMESNSVGKQAVGVEISIDGQNVEGGRSVGAQAVAVEISIDGGRSSNEGASGASESVEGGRGAEGETGHCRGRYRRRGCRSTDGGSGVEGREEEDKDEEECGNERRQQQRWGGFDEVVGASDGCGDVVSAERDAIAAIGGGEAVVDTPRTGFVIEGRARVTGGGKLLVSSRQSNHEARHKEGTHSFYHAGVRGTVREPLALSVDDAKHDTTPCTKSSGGVGIHHGGQRLSSVRVDYYPAQKSRENVGTAVVRARRKKTVSSSPQQLGRTNGAEGRPFLTTTVAATPSRLARSLGFFLGEGVVTVCCLVLLVCGTIVTMAGRRQQEP